MAGHRGFFRGSRFLLTSGVPTSPGREKISRGWGARDLQTEGVDVGAKPFGRTVPWDSGGASEVDIGRTTICPIPWPKPDRSERIVDKVGIPAVFRRVDPAHLRLTARNG
jgi:hypothetical protein